MFLLPFYRRFIFESNFDGDTTHFARCNKVVWRHSFIHLKMNISVFPPRRDRKPCKSRKTLQTEHLFTTLGFDTAPPKFVIFALDLDSLFTTQSFSMTAPRSTAVYVGQCCLRWSMLVNVVYVGQLLHRYLFRSLSCSRVSQKREKQA